jgi:hypothetical protein
MVADITFETLKFGGVVAALKKIGQTRVTRASFGVRSWFFMGEFASDQVV